MSKYKYPIVIAVLVVFVVLFSALNRDEKTYKYLAERITDAFIAEGIKYDESNYVTNDKQVKMYIFRGRGCSHCYELLEFINDELIKKYKDKVTFEVYETWNNKDNAQLFKRVAQFMGDSSNGVPYIIIGDKSWSGFSESNKSEIKQKIKEQYALDVSERYDVLTEMDKK